MPEAPEIKILADFVNYEVGKNEILKVEKNPISKNQCDLSVLEKKTWKVTATARGKEMMLFFRRGDESHSLKFSFAKVAGMETYSYDDVKSEAFNRNSMLRLYTKDKIYTFSDFTRLMYWRWATDWDPYRSPDIVTEHNLWRDHMYKNRKHKWFKDKTVFEVMLNQSFFNGVGTFCRTEILARTRFSPFTPFTEVLTEPILREDFFTHCREVMDDIHRLGGLQFKHWTNPFGVSTKKLARWSRCYSKYWSIIITDSRKKVFYFHKKWKHEYIQWENSKNT